METNNNEMYEENAVIDRGKEVIQKGGTAYVKGLNKRADMVATHMTKNIKPDTNDSEEVYTKYKEKYNAWKQSYKLAEISAIKGVLMGPAAPFDWLFTAAVGCGVMNSTDPSDAKIKELVEKSKNIFVKIKGLVSKENPEEINRKEVDRNVDILHVNCLRISKGIDKFKAAKREDVPKVKSAHFNQPVKESEETSSFNKEFIRESVERILYGGNDFINDVAIETVVRMIDKLDLNDEKDDYIIECCLDILNQDV